MESAITIGNIIGIMGKSVPLPFQHLNELYQDQELYFDEYGNPIYLPLDSDDINGNVSIISPSAPSLNKAI